MRIVHLHTIDREEIREQLAVMLHQAFPKEDGYPTLEEARDEVLESLREERINLIALAGKDQVLGWIGAIPTYRGHAYELHPLVVRADQRRRGIGRKLVAELEAQLRQRGLSPCTWAAMT